MEGNVIREKHYEKCDASFSFWQGIDLDIQTDTQKLYSNDCLILVQCRQAQLNPINYIT